jgi:5-methylcytosine-specific restriction endonuclease McrA
LIFGMAILLSITLFVKSRFTSNQNLKRERCEIPSDDSRYIPSEVVNEVWDRDRGRCVICGSQRQLELDHRIPYFKGGSNTANNIRILCKECNRRKSGKIE